jgi:2-haloacid dehalogenase
LKGGKLLKKRYNSLFIDLDDTLLDFTGDEKIAVLSTLDKYGLPSDEDAYTLYTEIENWQVFNLGEEIDAKAFITNRFKILLKILEAENIDAIAEDYYITMSKSHKLKKNTLKVLRYLKEQGYKLYITTNGYAEFQYKRIKASRISKFFDGIFVSEEINLHKPSKIYFDYVLNHIPESNRSRVLIIGDAPTADILGGINAKIDTCFLNDKDKLCKYKFTYKIRNICELMEIL